MSDELKACPFCGKMPRENSVTLPFDVGGRRKIAQCACGAFLYTGRWNTRPIEAELQQRIDELTAELTALREQVRWIPVSEKEPSDGVRYDVWLANNWQVKATYYNHTGMRYANPYWMNDCGVKISNVTHYKSLPQPPEGE